MNRHRAALRRGGAHLLVWLAAALAGAGAPAHAQSDGCASFDWPLATEKEWFTAPDVPSYASGAALPAFPKTGFALKLQPIQDVKFALAPEKPAESGSGGVVHLPAIEKRGLYQITLSEMAWIDVVQGGARLASRAHSGRKDCSALRKSVRFEFGPGPVTLQFSGTAAETLKIAVRDVSKE